MVSLQEDEDVSGGKSWDRNHHFSYYAFAGNSGELRWSHKSEVHSTCVDLVQFVLILWYATCLIMRYIVEHLENVSEARPNDMTFSRVFCQCEDKSVY